MALYLWVALKMRLLLHASIFSMVIAAVEASRVNGALFTVPSKSISYDGIDHTATKEAWVVLESSSTACALRCELKKECKYLAIIKEKSLSKGCSFAPDIESLQTHMSAGMEIFHRVAATTQTDEKEEPGASGEEPGIITVGECATGYTNDGASCVNIDECESGTHNCHNFGGKCSDTDGSYTCECKAGFIGDGHICKHDFGICMDYLSQNVPQVTVPVKAHESCTACLWLKPNTEGAALVISYNPTRDHCETVGIYVQNMRKLDIYFGHAYTTVQVDHFVWNHICVLWNAAEGTQVITVNSTVLAEETVLYTPVPESNMTVTIGNLPELDSSKCEIVSTQYAFRGQIREAFVWLRQLSAEELENVYKNERIPRFELALTWGEFRGKARTDQTELQLPEGETFDENCDD